MMMFVNLVKSLFVASPRIAPSHVVGVVARCTTRANAGGNAPNAHFTLTDGDHGVFEAIDWSRRDFGFLLMAPGDHVEFDWSPDTGDVSNFTNHTFNSEIAKRQSRK